MKKPLVAVTMGDPAGIGPEIILKTFADPSRTYSADCVVVGDIDVLNYMQNRIGTQVRLQAVESMEECHCRDGVLKVLDCGQIQAKDLKIGEISAVCGAAAYAYIKKAVDLAVSGEVDAVATAPIHKEALRAAGIPYIGHTEIFGALTATPDPLTMFQVRELRVFFLSRHISLTEACRFVTKEHVVACAKNCVAALRRLGVQEGEIAIAGLNPHSGEHGLFGDEEMKEIYPAVEQLQKEGYPVVGPVSADSVFHLALQGRYTAVLSLYHDQGHIATKTLDFERTISITNGMPILRTSVDHGTAFDIAGKGLASEVSMVEAIRLAALYAPCFKGGRL